MPNPRAETNGEKVSGISLLGGAQAGEHVGKFQASPPDELLTPRAILAEVSSRVPACLGFQGAVERASTLIQACLPGRAWRCLPLPLPQTVQSPPFSLKMPSSFLLQGFGPVAPGMLFLEASRRWLL